jgi:hypothetical protein
MRCRFSMSKGGDGGRFERAEYRAVCFFVISDKGTPAMIDKLPER